MQCLNKQLLYNFARSTHHPLVVCSNNAKSCYDQIILIVATLYLCCLGVPKSGVQSMVSMIYGMQHHIRLSYGNSTQSQGRQQWDAPITGMGQGNGAGPQIWAVVSTPLFQILTQDGFIAQIICAISGNKVEIAGFGFVDNVDLCIMGSQHQGNTAIPHMQESLNTWAGLLHATGGALVPDKCFWYNIHNWWEKGAWQYKQPNPENKLQVPDDAGKPIQIPQLAPGDARCTLGVRLAPDGNNKVEFFYLLDVAKSWQTSMAVAKITHTAVEFGLQQVILQKLEYPLVATMFTHQQCR